MNGSHPGNPKTLHPEYVKAINTLRPAVLQADEAGIKIGYEDSGWADFCKVSGIFAHIVGPATSSDGPAREEWDTKTTLALDMIHHIHPDLRRMVDLLVTDIVVFNSGVDGGGSANQMPGVVLMSPGPDWSVLNYAQCIVHEGLHSGLFILDTVYPMFTLPPTELEKDEYRALSAVKIGQKRPLHAAFHAAAVAVPLMFMENHQGGNDLVSKYTDSMRDACTDMLSKRAFFTPYGQLLLDEMSDWVKQEPLDFDQVARALTSREYAGYRPAVAA
ncbi:HEXXH motif-containing putative peptide modification protein [Streptomyces sp. NPDC020719]|uniref:aKG-HExxH-type peptide beta-hydroxylase n=1 Tax=Streptomyces sp. NPDC020719 TaxID=3154896 RepID=UPI0033F1B233